MSKRLVLSALAQFAAKTAGRNMTKAAYVAVTVGVGAMVLLTIAPTMRRRIAGSMRCCGVPRLFRVRMAGAAAPWRCKDGCDFYVRSSSGIVDAIGAVPCRSPSSAASSPGRMAACRLVDAQGRSRHSRPARLRRVLVVEIRPAVQRAGHLPDGAVAGLGRGLFPGARRPAGHLRQRACGDVVGDGDPDHRGLWRRGADHPARPHGRGAGDDIRARRVRAVDRHSRDRFCSRDTARQLPENLGVGQRCRSSPRSAPPRSPT